MEICNNKQTGQVFVCLDTQGEDKGLMISPNGIAITLNYNMFTETVEIRHEEALSKGLINRAQYNIYRLYRDH